jgi:thioredoxin-related protein
MAGNSSPYYTGIVLRALAAAVLFLPPLAASAQVASPYAIEHPPWFAQTFLDFREDIAEATRDGKRLLVYFGQDGCPYCARLMQTNFTQRAIVEKARRHFVVIAINIWGDREVTWVDGTRLGEKAFARQLRVQFTPTLVFFDEKGNIALRLNGYYPPRRLEAALDYVAGRMEPKLAFGEYLKRAVKDEASETLHPEPFFMPAPQDLARKPGSKPLAVLFETPYCSGCDEMHREGFQRAAVRAELAKFDIARFALGERAPITAPDGKAVRVDEWGRALKILYTPSIVFFDAQGREVFRTEAYLRPFHLAGSFAYVSSGAYLEEPSFQRFLQARAEHMRAQGKPVDLWK